MNRARLTVPILAILLIAAIAAFFVATSGGTTKTAASSSSAISLEQTSLGSVLTDASGRTLYYYVGDQQSGQTAGQGLNQFGARWYVLSSAGQAITSPATSTTPSSGSTYGY